METLTFDRVRANTAKNVNERLDQEALQRIERYGAADKATLTRRIAELDREWDTERVLEANASMLAFIGVVCGAVIHPYWLLLPGVVLSFLFLHAVQGWCPPLPLIRRLGVRTRSEIDAEKYALKVLRGDFFGVTSASGAAAALQATRK